jgi:hypothetical protein
MQGLYLHTGQQNKCTQAFNCGVGFKPTISVYERAKSVNALDRSSTVIGLMQSSSDHMLRIVPGSSTKNLPNSKDLARFSYHTKYSCERKFVTSMANPSVPY